jgi:hypothetical protein
MSGVTNEYRKQAELCRKNAEGSLKQEDRAFWLLLAANWPKLAQDCARTAEDRIGLCPMASRNFTSDCSEMLIYYLSRVPK